MAPVEHARSGDENGAAVAALAQMRTVTAIVAVAGRPRRAGGRAGLLGRPRRRARVGGGVWVFRTVCFERVVLSTAQACRVLGISEATLCRWRWRARAADGGWLYSEGSIRSGRFHPIGNKQCGGIGASRPRQHGLCVAWHLPSGTIGARLNAKPAPGTRRAASCDVRECCTAAPGGFKHGRLACPASDGRVSGARQARAARVPWV